jgi:hypothetical protein
VKLPAWIAATSLALAGCAERPPKIAVFNGGAGLDCTAGFENLVREISTKPDIVAAIHDRGASAYREDRTATLYLVTLPDHPAHPAIFKRSVVPGSERSFVVSGACGYGDKAALDREIEAYDAFDKLLNAEEACFLCGEGRLESPTIGRQLPPPPPPPVAQDRP